MFTHDAFLAVDCKFVAAVLTGAPARSSLCFNFMQSPDWVETFYPSQALHQNIWAVHPAAMATGILQRGTGLWWSTFHFVSTNQRPGRGSIHLSLLCSVGVIQWWECMRRRPRGMGIPSTTLPTTTDCTDTSLMYLWNGTIKLQLDFLFIVIRFGV